MALFPAGSMSLFSELTFEGIIKVFLPKDNPQVMDGTGVELHTEDDISGWAPELLVVALQLVGRRAEPIRGPRRGNQISGSSLLAP